MSESFLVSPPAYVLCFDPGPHTGVAAFLYGQLTASLTIEADAAHVGTRYQMIHGHIHGAAAFGGDAGPIIVCENFHTVMPLTRDGFITLKLIGWIEGVARLAGFETVFQMPGVRVPYLADAKRLVGRGKPHELDAAAHGLAFLARWG